MNPTIVLAMNHVVDTYYVVMVELISWIISRYVNLARFGERHRWKIWMLIAILIGALIYGTGYVFVNLWQALKVGFFTGADQGFSHMVKGLIGIKLLSYFLVYGFILYKAAATFVLLSKDLSIDLSLNIIAKYVEAGSNIGKFSFNVLLRGIGLVLTAIFRVDDKTLKMLLSGEFENLQFKDMSMDLPAIRQAVKRLEEINQLFDQLVKKVAVSVTWLIVFGIIAQALNYLKWSILPADNPLIIDMTSNAGFFFAMLIWGIGLIGAINWNVQIQKGAAK